MDVIYAFSLGILLSLLVKQEIDFRFIPFSITILGLMEIIAQLRWRLSLPCSKCGFDPLLYIKSPEKAARRVKAHLEERKNDPNLLNKSLPIFEEKKKGALVRINSDRQIDQNKI